MIDLNPKLKRKIELVISNQGDINLSHLDAILEVGDKIDALSSTVSESIKAIPEAKDFPEISFTATNALLQRLLDKETETKGIEDGLTALGVLIVENKAERVDTKGIEALLGKLLKKDELIEVTLTIA